MNAFFDRYCDCHYDDEWNLMVKPRGSKTFFAKKEVDIARECRMTQRAVSKSIFDMRMDGSIPNRHDD